MAQVTEGLLTKNTRRLAGAQLERSGIAMQEALGGGTNPPTHNPALRRQRFKDVGFKASLGYVV